MSSSKILMTQRFLEVVELLKKEGYADSDAKVYKSIGVSASKYNDIKHGRGRYVTSDMMNDIADKFPVNVLYILREEGESLTVPMGNGKSVLKEKSKTEVKSVVITVDQLGNSIPMIDIEAVSKYIKKHNDPDFFKEMPTLRLPGKKYKNAIFRCFQVDGISMSNTLNHKEWVIAEYVEEHTDLKDGDIYVIVTKEKVAIKRVFSRIEEGIIELSSDNKSYKPYSVKINDILEIWQFIKPLDLSKL